MPFDWSLPQSPDLAMGAGPPGNVFERFALDATVPTTPIAPSSSDYRVLSPEEALPENEGRWERLIQAAQGGGRHLRPKQQRTLDAMPKVLSEEGMTRKQRLAYRDDQAIKAGQPTRRERIMGELGALFSGMAAGAAASTGIPAWQRANAQLMHDRAYGDAQQAQEQQSRLATLASLGRSQAAEAKSRQGLLTDPMVEFEGQVMPRAAADSILNRRLRGDLAGQTEERMRETEEGRNEDRDAARGLQERAIGAREAGQEGSAAYRDEVLGLRKKGLSNLEQHRKAMRGFTERSVSAREKGAGGKKGGASIPNAKQALDKAMMEAGLDPQYDRPTRPIKQRARDIIAEWEDVRGMDDPFGDIMADLETDDVEDQF